MPDVATQERDYSGLRWKKITPTDIDGLLDFGKKAWVLFELKHRGAQMPDGQRIAIENIIDDLDRKPSIAFVAEHEKCAVIDAALAIVTRFYWHRKWHPDSRGLTLKQSIDGFLEKAGLLEK